MSTLLLRLSGPMQSWGTSSRFRVRDTVMEPTKSGVIGLLCAALGKPREEIPEHASQWPALKTLSSLTMGVRVDREGQLKRDYQTAGGAHRKGDTYGVVNANNNNRSTVVSERFYLADAQFIVGLESGDTALLDRLQAALLAPVWPLSLGRKSYVPGAPVALPDGVRAEGLEDALSTYPWLARTGAEADRMRRRVAAGPVRLRLILDAPFGSTPDLRHDVPLDFERREFSVRSVTVTAMDLRAESIKEESACFSHA